MAKASVKPTVEVRGVKFGTKREMARKVFGSNCREFRKSIFSKNTTDDYGSFHAFYDKGNCMVAVEFFEGEGSFVAKSCFLQSFPQFVL